MSLVRLAWLDRRVRVFVVPAGNFCAITLAKVGSPVGSGAPQHALAGLGERIVDLALALEHLRRGSCRASGDAVSSTWSSISVPGCRRRPAGATSGSSARPRPAALGDLDPRVDLARSGPVPGVSFGTLVSWRQLVELLQRAVMSNFCLSAAEFLIRSGVHPRHGSARADRPLRRSTWASSRVRRFGALVGARPAANVARRR